MENLEYLDIVTEDREVMKIYLSWMELKQQEDPQSILNKIKTAGKTVLSDAPQIARKRQMEELKAKKDLIFTNEIDGLLVRNLEEFSWLIEEGYQKEMIADYMFYGYNKEAVKEYQRLSWYSNSNDVSIGIKTKRDGTVRTSECGPVPLWLSAIDGVCTMREE